ncbi:MAG: hypothetical protein Q8L48_15020 [Archangium sp.]|nr:hypothetical protein [Archangium sp.]
MLSLSLALLVGVTSPGTSPVPDRVPTGFTVSVERVDLSGAATVVVDPLLGRVLVQGASLSGKAPRLCPTVERKGDQLTLRCTTKKLWAEVSHDVRGHFIDLRELSGVSWLDLSLLPMKGWAPHSVLLPDTCPGTLAAARGECALARGELEAARAAWTDGLTGPDASLCHLRLGDLAIREGAIEAALAYYAKVPPVGFIGRMGQARTCELLGTCLTEDASTHAGNTEALPAELARELTLFSVRRELAAGRDGRAMQVLLALMETDREACEGWLPLCQKFLAVGFASDSADARIAALSAFLTDKARRGPAEYELNRAASLTARDLGAPAFAASILSANTPKVPAAELSAHLLEIVRLYLAARDPVRATVVLEYAEGKLGAGAYRGGWNGARRQLGRRAGTAVAAPTVERSLEALSTQVSLSTDLARAAALRSRASIPENAP